VVERSDTTGCGDAPANDPAGIAARLGRCCDPCGVDTAFVRIVPVVSLRSTTG
jgi:hypothetical protein